MAESKYLNRGGLEYLWSKVKSWINTWKQTNFGSGTYSVGSGHSLSVLDAITDYNPDSNIGTRIEVDDFQIISAKLLVSAEVSTARLTKPHGIAIIQKRTTLTKPEIATNRSGEDISVMILTIQEANNTTYLRQNYATYKDGDTINAAQGSGSITILFW